MGIFDIIGPIMIGPSSSHTAGAVKIGYFASRIAGGNFDSVEVNLFNSFSETGRGHGTDIAIIAGILGFGVDDKQIVDSFEIAKSKNLNFKINWKGENENYPENCAELIFHSSRGLYDIVGNSIGGGEVSIININGYDVSLSFKHPVLMIFSFDVPGVIAYVASIISVNGINIAKMEVERDSSRGESLAVFKLDRDFPPDEIKLIKENKSIKEVIILERSI
ncbi:MAG: L-serine ammonia-lyase, iron-sulfur-dependent subunit beta [Caldisericaceae bacterium]